MRSMRQVAKLNFMILAVLPSPGVGQADTTAQAIVAEAIRYELAYQNPDSSMTVVIDAASTGTSPDALAERLGVTTGENPVTCGPPRFGPGGPRACTMPRDLLLLGYHGLTVSGGVARVSLFFRARGPTDELVASGVGLELRQSAQGRWVVAKVLGRGAS